MSIRIRLALLLSAIVIVTVAIAWIFTRRQVVLPFVAQSQQVSVTQALEAADRYDDGEELDQISRQLGRRIELARRLPHSVRTALRRKGQCRSLVRQGYDLIVCPEPQSPIFVRSDFGWLIVQDSFDAEKRGRGLGRALLVMALVIVGASAWVAVLLTRPIRTTVHAMEQIARGDLHHRLPESGSRELAEVARAFNRMVDRVDQVLTAEREMMAGISHELRTPLARLRLEIELLSEQGVSEARRLAMEGDLEEIDQLIGELLTLSRLRIGERQIAQERLDLMDVAKGAVERCPMPRHSVLVTGQGGDIQGDEVRLVRVVTNLLENARKYAPAGSTVHVEVNGRRLTVRDEGQGVSTADLERLFEPFFRTDGARGSATGSGLGLMIARQVVELHGGHIEAKNVPSGGLAISFTLPEPTQMAGHDRPSPKDASSV